MWYRGPRTHIHTGQKMSGLGCPGRSLFCPNPIHHSLSSSSTAFAASPHLLALPPFLRLVLLHSLVRLPVAARSIPQHPPPPPPPPLGARVLHCTCFSTRFFILFFLRADVGLSTLLAGSNSCRAFRHSFNFPLLFGVHSTSLLCYFVTLSPRSFALGPAVLTLPLPSGFLGWCPCSLAILSRRK